MSSADLPALGNPKTRRSPRPNISVLIPGRVGEGDLSSALERVLDYGRAADVQVVLVVAGGDERVSQALGRFRAEPRAVVRFGPASLDRAQLLERASLLATGDVLVARDASEIAECGWLDAVLRVRGVDPESPVLQASARSS